MPPDNLPDMKCYINGVPLNTEYNEFRVMSVYYKNRKWVAYCDKNDFAIAKKRKLVIKKMDKPNVVYAIMGEAQTVKVGCWYKIANNEIQANPLDDNKTQAKTENE